MRHVRNFWIETDVDGKAERLASGPRSLTGGFKTIVLARVDGSPERVVSLVGRVLNGRLYLSWTICLKGLVFSSGSFCVEDAGQVASDKELEGSGA